MVSVQQRRSLEMISPQDAIPRIIHQTYPTKSLPAELRRNVERIKALNPTYEHRLYDDADIECFIMDQYGREMLAAYHQINPDYGAARADLFRYLLIYAVGGVYLDIKSTTTQPLAETLRADDVYVLSQWDNGPGRPFEKVGTNAECRHIPGGEFQQWYVIAAPGHPFLRAVIEKVLDNIKRYRPWRHGHARIGTLRLTGPRAYSNAIAPLLAHHPHRRTMYEDGLGLAYTSYSQTTAHRSVYAKHYHTNRTPIVIGHGANRLIFPLYLHGWRIYRGLKSIGGI